MYEILPVQTVAFPLRHRGVRLSASASGAPASRAPASGPAVCLGVLVLLLEHRELILSLRERLEPALGVLLLVELELLLEVGAPEGVLALDLRQFAVVHPQPGGRGGRGLAEERGEEEVRGQGGAAVAVQLVLGLVVGPAAAAGFLAPAVVVH